jgi:hypothetical protein
MSPLSCFMGAGRDGIVRACYPTADGVGKEADRKKASLERAFTTKVSGISDALALRSPYA